MDKEVEPEKSATPPVGYIDGAGETLQRLGDFTTRPRVLLISGIAIIVGTVGFAVGVGLLKLIQLITNLAYFGRFTLGFPSFADSPLGLAAIIVPMVGGLIVGLMAYYGTEQIRGHGIPEAIEAILLGRSRLDVKVAILKPLSSAIAIGTGGPFGAEGPIIMTGGALGSLIAQLLPVTDAERKTLLVAGAAAGMTTVFGTPIASILLAVELLLFEWSPRSFVPVAAAAITAEVERTLLGGVLALRSPLFPFNGGMTLSLVAVGCLIGIGVLSGLLSGLLTQLVYFCEDQFLKLPIHWMWWPILGGLVVGVGGWIEPQALGVGYAHIGHMLQGGILPLAAILLLVVKAIIWAVALGSGTSGGVLAPLLIMGGAMGAALAHVLPTASPGFWALLGMCATMGGTMRSPLTATFFAVELTGNTHVLFPLITACATAHLCTVLLMKRSILTEKISRHGHHLTREYRVDPFALTRVREVMTTPVESVAGTMTLHETVRFLTDPKTAHPSFPVVDVENRVLGIVDPPTVMAWRRAGKHRHTTLVELLSGTRVPVVFPDDFLEGVIDRMNQANIAHLPVVSPGDHKLQGYVSWKDLLRVRTRQLQQDEEQVAFFRKRPSNGNPAQRRGRIVTH